MPLTSSCINVTYIDINVEKKKMQINKYYKQIFIRKGMSFIPRVLEFGILSLSVASKEDGDSPAHHAIFFDPQIQPCYLPVILRYY
jgi:hypothetical protein